MGAGRSPCAGGGDGRPRSSWGLGSGGCCATAAALSLLSNRLILPGPFGSEKGNGAGSNEFWEGEVDDDEDGEESGSAFCLSVYLAAAKVKEEPAAPPPSAEHGWISRGSVVGCAATRRVAFETESGTRKRRERDDMLPSGMKSEGTSNQRYCTRSHATYQATLVSGTIMFIVVTCASIVSIVMVGMVMVQLSITLLRKEPLLKMSPSIGSSHEGTELET